MKISKNSEVNSGKRFFIKKKAKPKYSVEEEINRNKTKLRASKNINQESRDQSSLKKN